MIANTLITSTLQIIKINEVSSDFTELWTGKLYNAVSALTDQRIIHSVTFLKVMSVQ